MSLNLPQSWNHRALIGLANSYHCSKAVGGHRLRGLSLLLTVNSCTRSVLSTIVGGVFYARNHLSIAPIKFQKINNQPSDWLFSHLVCSLRFATCITGDERDRLCRKTIMGEKNLKDP